MPLRLRSQRAVDHSWAPPHVRRRDDLITQTEEEWIGPDQEGSNPLASKRRKSRINVAFGARIQDVNNRP
jgi:hypothetical protein